MVEYVEELLQHMEEENYAHAMANKSGLVIFFLILIFVSCMVSDHICMKVS